MYVDTVGSGDVSIGIGPRLLNKNILKSRLINKEFEAWFLFSDVSQSEAMGGFTKAGVLGNADPDTLKWPA